MSEELLREAPSLVPLQLITPYSLLPNPYSLSRDVGCVAAAATVWHVD